MRGSSLALSVFAVAFSADGRRIFSIGKEGIGRIIDVDSDQVLHEWQDYHHLRPGSKSNQSSKTI